MDTSDFQLDDIQNKLVDDLERLLALFGINDLYLVAEGNTLSVYKREVLDNALDSELPMDNDGNLREEIPGRFLTDILFENFSEDKIRYLKSNVYED